MWLTIDHLLNEIFDLWFWLLKSLPDLWQVLITALPVTFIALLVLRCSPRFKQTGETGESQEKALPISLSVRGLRAPLRRILISMVGTLIPAALLVIQIESRFAFRPIHVGESAILEVVVGETGSGEWLDAVLSTADGLVAETPSLRLKPEGRVLWRVRGIRPGVHDVWIQTGSSKIATQVFVGETQFHPSLVLLPSDDMGALRYSVEGPKGKKVAIQSVDFSYPPARSRFAGLSGASWLLLAVCMVSVWACGRYLRRRATFTKG